MKECNECNKILELSMFNKRKASKDGLNHKCKVCVKQHNKQYYQDNTGYIKQHNKQYYQNNVESFKQRQKQYNSQLPSGVYMIKCLINGKRYVGESIKPIRRKTDHFSNYKSSKSVKGTNASLQADLKQYGRNAFVFGIIEYCEPKQLLERETYYINLYKPEYN